MNVTQQSTQLFVTDFNRTIFDPDRRSLIHGAVEVLQAVKAHGFVSVLLSQAVENRRKLIAELGLEPYFDEIILTSTKTPAILAELATRHRAKPEHSFVLGDRAHGEIALGAAAGWRTIWLQAGRFADELPAANRRPTHTIHSLAEVPSLIARS